MPKPLLTKEQESFVKQNVLNTSNKDLTDLVNNTFNLNLSCEQLTNWKSKRHIKSNLTGFFQKGQQPHNCLPIGATKTRGDGYTYTKVKSEGTQNDRWKLTHRLLWEKEYGPIPAGYSLIFLDQDKTNISLNNLALISKAECLMANEHKLLFADKELTYSGLQITKLLRKTSQLKNKRKRTASIKPSVEGEKLECRQKV